MSTSKTKLGPWKTSHNGTSVVMANDKTYKLVASVFGDRDDCYPDDAMLANARLIAAAPDLLHAVRRCALVMAGETLHKQGLVDALELARSAMNKALGETE